MPEDVPAHRHPVLCELVPIGNDRDHEASCYADARSRGRFRRRASASRRRMRRMRNVGRNLLVAAIALAALVAAPTAAADYADEQALAERHAPIVRIVEQTEECGHGEPFIPTDIDLILDEPTVALRGPWNRTDLVKIGPSAKDLVDRFEYHLDFPGDPLDPGCDYAHWAKRLTAGSEPVVYAHVVTEPRAPGEGLAPVLVLLPLQRLQQHARRRLGDDPARLRRERRRRGARSRSGGGWLQRARGGNALELGGRPARGRGRDATRRLPRRRLAREQVLGCALARELRRGRCRLRRHARAAPGALAESGDHPERSCGRRGRISVDCVRGTLGRAAEGLLQRPDRPEPEDAMDEADHVVRRLERPELRDTGRRRVRDRYDRLLLRGGRARLASARAASCGTRCRPSSSSRRSSGS